MMRRPVPPLYVPLLGYLLQFFGFEWDVVWHVYSRREDFWTVPHLLVYAGVALVLVAGAYPIVAGRGRAPLGSYALAGAALAQVAMAPVDDLWHRLYGLDNTLWSFPHLAFIFGGAASVLALPLLLRRPSVRPAGSPSSRWDLAGLVRDPAMILFALLLCALDITLLEFELNLPPPYWPWHYGLYLPLLAAAALVAGAAAYGFTGRVGALTCVCAAFTALQWGVNLELLGLGYRSLPIVPPVLPGALAADWLLARGNRLAPPLRAALAGLVFTGVLYAVVIPYGAIVSPPRWPFIASPWQPAALVAGWPLAAALAPLAASLGLILGQFLRRMGATRPWSLRAAAPRRAIVAPGSPTDAAPAEPRAARPFRPSAVQRAPRSPVLPAARDHGGLHPPGARLPPCPQKSSTSAT